MERPSGRASVRWEASPGGREQRADETLDLQRPRGGLEHHHGRMDSSGEQILSAHTKPVSKRP